MNRSNAATIVAALALLIGAALVAAPMVFPAPDGDARPQDVPVAQRLAPTGDRYVTAWLPYWKFDDAVHSFTQNADLFTDVTAFLHSIVGPEGDLAYRGGSGDQERIIAEARSRGLPAIAAVLDETAPGTMARLLADPDRRAAHIAALLPLVDRVGFDGIDIDYENFAFADGSGTWPTTRPAWVAFITELGAELKRRDKYLTVAVPPQFNADNDASSGYWVYDWPAIAPHIDSLRAMTYDFSVTEPGPVAPLPWVARTAAFGVAVLGPDKFRIGVPTYGRDWALNRDGPGCGGLSAQVSRTAVALLDIAVEAGAEVRFDPAIGESTFDYPQDLGDCAVNRRAYVSDAPSVAAKAELARTNGAGIALWSLGGEDPASWEGLRRLREVVPPE